MVVPTGSTTTVTREVSAGPPGTPATTRKAPALEPAVKTPFESMEPPVAVKVAVIGVVLPSLILPTAVNCCF